MLRRVAQTHDRDQSKPNLVECKTYRFFDHVGVRGMGLTYRTDEELEEWQKRDPIHLFEARLPKLDVLSRDEAAGFHEGMVSKTSMGAR